MYVFLIGSLNYVNSAVALERASFNMKVFVDDCLFLVITFQVIVVNNRLVLWIMNSAIRFRLRRFLTPEMI